MSTVAVVESGGTVRVDASIEGSLSKRDGYGMTTASTVLRGQRESTTGSRRPVRFARGDWWLSGARVSWSDAWPSREDQRATTLAMKLGGRRLVARRHSGVDVGVCGDGYRQIRPSVAGSCLALACGRRRGGGEGVSPPWRRSAGASVMPSCGTTPVSQTRTATLRYKPLSRGSRGGYPLAALGSEDWCNPSHGGVFSDGRPSVHGVAPSPTAPASSRVSRE